MQQIVGDVETEDVILGRDADGGGEGEGGHHRGGRRIENI